MNQIMFFAIGITLLVLIPLTYFCFSKIISKKTSNKTSVLVAIVFAFVLAITIFIAINAYAYFINVQDSIVCERYVLSLSENSANNNYDKHLNDTIYISYPDISDLQKTFDKTAELKIIDIKSIYVSIERWTDEKEGFTHLYMYLDEFDIYYDFGLIKNDNFWDIASVEFVDANKIDEILASEKFVKLR